MSDVFEGSERQYCELSANLIRKMDLEARSRQPNVKAVLLAKLREYKNGLNALKNQVKRLSSGYTVSARDELLESGMADAVTLGGVDENIGKSKRILSNMSRRMNKNTWIIASVVIFLIIAIGVILYLTQVE